MQFGQSGNPESPFKLVFEGDEVDVVRAVYREMIYNLALHGNVGSISNYDATVAGWEEGENQSVIVPSYTSVTDKLEDFHANTDEAITEIIEVTGLPPYANEYIHERHTLGQTALELANTIRETATLETSTIGLEDELAEFIEGQGKPQ